MTTGAGRAVVVAGSLAARAGRGGHAWAFLQYLHGFRRLLGDAVFVDAAVSQPGGPTSAEQARYFTTTMAGAGLGGRSALLGPDGRTTAGLGRDDVLAAVEDCAFLLNVMGFLDDREILDRAPERAFLDIDPGFGQMWRAAGLADVFAGHDRFLTVGENVGRPSCAVPTCGLDWAPTRPPVVLDQWPVSPGCTDRFTTVASWRGPFGPVDHGGRTYGLRAHEFRRFAELPRLTGQTFELALDIHHAEKDDLALLERNGWRLVDPTRAVPTPDAYQAYIRGSKAELMVAKNMYVDTKSGWFSDRSVCYLASGKPVLAQDTGIRDLYPTGEGLLVFSTVEEAAAGVHEINANYEKHCRAARAVAEECFDSDEVLGRLLARAGVA